jgi:serine/threonine protein kinase
MLLRFFILPIKLIPHVSIFQLNGIMGTDLSTTQTVEIFSMAFTDPLIGKRLGDYSIESVLGTGGMARVYRGYDDNLDRFAAIKVIEPQLIASAEEDEYRERFLREARAIARLNHNRIVSVYQFNQIGNLYYIAMAYIEGDNLRDILKGYLKQGRLIPTEELLVVLRDIADALDYAHKQGIIHRDIKPSNIIVTPAGNAVLTDFGLALNAVEGTIGNTFGSVHYIAPEQAISSAQAVPQSDQYSLGIVAYELLTGRVPFDDASAMSVALKHISDPPPPPTEINPNIPAEVEQVLLKALDKEPNRRFESARDFVRSLELAFEMSKTGDIAAPKSIVEAIGAPPKTNPFPPSMLGVSDDKKTIKDPIGLNDTSGSIPERKTSSIPLADNGRAGWSVAGLLVVLILLIGGYVVYTQIQNNNANATATAQVMAMQETNIAATSTAIESTSSAIIAQQTSNYETEMAEGTSTAEALSQAETANVMATDNQATDDAATAIQESTNAALIATQAAHETSTAHAVASQEAQATATIQVQETRSAATAQAELLQSTNAASTAQAISLESTNDAATSQARSDATSTRMAAIASPTMTNTAQATATFTPSPTLTPTVTPLPSLTPTPSLLINDESDTAQVLLRYDGRMFILANRDTVNGIDVSELVFVQVAPDENGIFRETIVFNIGRTDLAEAAANVADSRCLEIIDSGQFSVLPPQNPLASNLCVGTPFWVTTVSPFWMHESDQAYFEVRLGQVDVLTRCPVQRPFTRAELRCAIDLNAIP